MARSIHFTTGTGTPAAVKINSASDFLAVSATNAEAAVYFLKLWWSGNKTGAATVGATIPSLTIPVGTDGLTWSLNFPLNLGGLLYYWVTLDAGDTDATALTNGGDVITIVYD